MIDVKNLTEADLTRDIDTQAGCHEANAFGEDALGAWMQCAVAIPGLGIQWNSCLDPIRQETAAVGPEQDLTTGFQLVVDYDENTEYPVTIGFANWPRDNLLQRGC